VTVRGTQPVSLGPARKTQLPRGRYWKDGVSGPVGLTALPDLLVEDEWCGNQVLVVVDAKHYGESSWPATDSIVKQLIYRHLLSQRHQACNLPIDKIGNAFLMPVVLADASVRQRAIHDIDGANSSDSFGRIVCLDVDYRAVASSYVRRRANARLRELVVDSVMRGMNAPYR